MSKKRVVIGISGGVDSSVSAYLLKKKGFEVIGVTLNHNQEKEFEDEIIIAKKICEFIGIKHIIIDMEEIFKKEVVDNFIDGYSKGITPSPCIICDERVKMKLLFDVAEREGAYYVSTGHYCSVEYNKEFNTYLIKKGKDERKDQSYMLYRLNREKIERLIFPLSQYSKEQIREIAKDIGLEVHNKKDSQGICFAKKGYINFLKKKLGDNIKKGNFKFKDGRVAGQHEGYQLYTLGQRRGLNLKLPRPYFIVDINPERNEIILGEYQELARKRVKLVDYKEIVPLRSLKDITVIGRPRFSSLGAEGKVYLENGVIYFEYLEESVQNAPGQHLVIYYKNFVLGGGMIEF